MTLAKRTTLCGLCRERILKDIDEMDRWDSRWVHAHCAARAARQRQANLDRLRRS